MSKKNVTGLKGELGYVVFCTIIEICLVGIFSKLLLKRIDWPDFTYAAIFPSLMGSIIGLCSKDDINEKKIKLYNPFKVWKSLIGFIVTVLIITIFITCVIYDMEWSIVTLEVFIVTFLSSELAYALVPIWN